MKIFKNLFMLLLVASISHSIKAQVDLTNFPTRSQWLNQYTSVFICSPNSGTIIQDVHNDADQDIYANSDRFYQYENGAYVELPQDQSVTIMQPGRGYVLQLGGNGNYADVIPPVNRFFNFSGASANISPVNTPVANSFNLLGNPFAEFLNLDAFLLNSNNKTKVKGPIMLWSHNTIISSANINPNDSTSTYRNSANDFALYNVLGGVAAGRQISTSADNGTQTGIQTPNGKICFGTGFGIYGISSGNVVYDNTMKTTGDNSDAQSFRLVNQELSQKDVADKPTAIVPSVRSRIWLNLERGTPPSSGNNNNPLKQALVGYSPCYGTDCPTPGDSDRVFDAETVTADSNPSMDLYSFASGSTKHLAIQGRKDFANSDSFKIGYKATAGTHTFTATADGMFTSTPYYIYDANDGQYHTLPYTFTAPGGTEDNRFKIVFENLIPFVYPPNVCGSQLLNISNSVYAQSITGVTTYHFEVRTGSDTGPIFGEYTNQNSTYPYTFNLNIPGITYNTDYWVRVAIYQLNGVWQYGPVCQIRTPLNPPTSKLTDTVGAFEGSCGKTITSYAYTLYAGSPSEIGYSTVGWRFEVREDSPTGNVVGIVPSNANYFSLAQLRPGYEPLPNKTYYVRVQIKYGPAGNQQWQVDNLGNPVYGPSCPVYTSANPTGRITNIPISDFETKAYPNPFTGSFKIEINSTSDEKIQIKIYDLLGRLIDQIDSTINDIENQHIGDKLNTGVYNIIVSQGENTKTMRVVKR